MFGGGFGNPMGMGFGGPREVRTETIRQTPFGTVDTITDTVGYGGGYGGYGGGYGMGYGPTEVRT